MKIAAHQEENEKTKKNKRKSEERRQATDLKEAACCPSAVVQGVARQRNSSAPINSRLNVVVPFPTPFGLD